MGYFEHNKNGKNISISVGHDVEYERAVKKADKLQRRANKNMERRINREYRRGSSIPAILKVVLLVIGVTMLISFLRYSDFTRALSFESLLNFLNDLPSVNWDWLNIQEVTLSLPGWLDWLNTLINFFVQLIKFLSFILAGLWQAVTFILELLRFLFVS